MSVSGAKPDSFQGRVKTSQIGSLTDIQRDMNLGPLCPRFCFKTQLWYKSGWLLFTDIGFCSRLSGDTFDLVDIGSDQTGTDRERLAANQAILDTGFDHTLEQMPKRGRLDINIDC